jgi:hypothetical protein
MFTGYQPKILQDAIPRQHKYLMTGEKAGINTSMKTSAEVIESLTQSHRNW